MFEHYFEKECPNFKHGSLNFFFQIGHIYVIYIILSTFVFCFLFSRNIYIDSHTSRSGKFQLRMLSLLSSDNVGRV